MAILNIEIPDDKIQRVLNAMNKYADSVSFLVFKPGNKLLLTGDRISWSYPSQGSMTTKQFCETCVKEFLKAMIKCSEYADLLYSYRQEVEEVQIPLEPEDIEI